MEPVNRFIFQKAALQMGSQGETSCIEKQSSVVKGMPSSAGGFVMKSEAGETKISP